MKNSLQTTRQLNLSTDVNVIAEKKKIYVIDKNPVLAEGIASLLIGSSHLSAFSIVVQSITDLSTFTYDISDIVIFDPVQILQSCLFSSRDFASLAKTTSLIGYCPDITADKLRLFTDSGFRAIMPKQVSGVELVRVVCSVTFGGVYLHDSYSKPSTTEVRTQADLDLLTEREAAVLRNLALGVSMKQIAAILDISTKTVDTYKTRANRKLNLNSRADIVQFAIQSGWMN